MIILAFDTCFSACSVAIQHGDDVFQSFERRDKGHAERLMPMIDDLLREARLRMRDVNRVAVTLGPGTFTGTRIGVAAARAFGLSLPLTIVGISSLAAMAQEAYAIGEARPGQRVMVVQDARREAVYAQVFSGEASKPDANPQLLPIAEAAERSREVAVVTGTASHFFDGVTQGTVTVPNASCLLDLAASAAPAKTLFPIYLREADAKPQSASVVARI